MDAAFKNTEVQACDPVARNFINRAAGRLTKMFNAAAEDYGLHCSFMITPSYLSIYVHHPYINGYSAGIYIYADFSWYNHKPAGENVSCWNKKLNAIHNLLTNYEKNKYQCISI